MPYYDYECPDCEIVEEDVFHRMYEKVSIECPECEEEMEKIITLGHGGIKKNDAAWIRSVNGYLNDLEFVHNKKAEYIETRDQARAHIERQYSDPHPKVQELKKEYLDRF